MFAQRRNLVAMHEAGVLFRAWGVALGKKLEQVLAKKRRKLLPAIEEEVGGKPVVADEEEVEEDFLDEGQCNVIQVYFILPEIKVILKSFCFFQRIFNSLKKNL